MIRCGRFLAAAAVALALLSGCGGSGKPELEVSAAASLRSAFTRYAKSLPGMDVRYSFAGSDALAAQIEQGVRPDVFASANTKLPEKLFANGLVAAPVVFAANRLVIAVPSGSKVNSLADLERPGVSIAVGVPTVPVGDYTQKVLARLPAAGRARLLANVADRESDVTGIVGKLSQGAIDAGFLYATDVKATDGQVRAIALPASLQPQVAYGVAIVKGSSHTSQARQFIAGLLNGEGRAQLLSAGFLPPPS